MAVYGDRAVLWGAAAAADLSNRQYHIVLLDSASEVNLTAAAADKAFGILQNIPQSGEEGAVLTKGISKVKAGDTITANDYFMSNASGTAIVANSTATTKVVGQAITAAASGGVFTGEINVREII